MRLLAGIDNIKNTDIIVVANNRQALVFKQQFSAKNTILPKILTWNSLLIYFWEQNNHQQKRLIDSDESYFIFNKIINNSPIIHSKSIVNEVLTNYSWLKKQQIPVAEITCENQKHEYFLTWVEKYQNQKNKHNLIDIFDLRDFVNKDENTYYSYGFRSLTSQQKQVFEKLAVQEIAIKQPKNQFQAKKFASFDDEITTAINWSLKLREKDENKSIVIIAPELEKNYFVFKNNFNYALKQSFIQTKNKFFNISIGRSLSEFNLIDDLLLVLNISSQIIDNKIKTTDFIKILNSKFIGGNNNYFLHNKILKLSKEFLSKDDIINLTCENEFFTKIFTQLNKQDKQDNPYSAWLIVFSDILNLWEFNKNRKMTSDEYQIWTKYLSSILNFNKYDIFTTKVSLKTAIKDFNAMLDRVVFQPQSGENQIQIMGVLEAEGLQFDNAWILGVNNSVIPSKINQLKYIPLNICQKYKIPKSDYNHIVSDSINSIFYLSLTAKEPIISFAKVVDDVASFGSSLINWDNAVEDIQVIKLLNPQLENIDDFKAPKLQDKKISRAIKILKNQALCQFSGFVNRLNIEEFTDETVGFNALDLGNILHNSLEKLYQKITNKQQLLALSTTEITDEITKSIENSMLEFSKNGFYTVVFSQIFNKIQAFLELEKQRDNWQVFATEKTQKVRLKELEFNIRVDRIDKNDNGEMIIFDYKLGSAIPSKWCGSITEPQLPIYAINNDSNAICFISFKDGIKYSGMAENNEILPKTTKLCSENWNQQNDFWQQTLSATADDFKNGNALVNPGKDACKYCNLTSFCRVGK